MGFSPLSSQVKGTGPHEKFTTEEVPGQPAAGRWISSIQDRAGLRDYMARADTKDGQDMAGNGERWAKGKDLALIERHRPSLLSAVQGEVREVASELMAG